MKEHHNMWAYIYYSLYLDQVDSSDQNAIEKYIHGKVKFMWQLGEEGGVRVDGMEGDEK